MTRLAVLFSAAAILTAIPYGSAGPACAKKYWQQKNCVEMCSGKWGYPGLMMGTGPWGTVIQKTAEGNWDSIIAEACGVSVSSTATAPAASVSVAHAVGSSPPTFSNSTAAASTTQIASSSSVSSVSSSASASSFIASSSSVIASSKEQQPSPTSSSVFTPPPPPPTTSSTVEQAAPTTNAPAPAVTTASSSSSSSSSGSSGSNGSGASDSDVQAYLSAHNTVRAQHGATALTWSNDAAAAAQKWANNCVFQHSGGTLGPFGENLAAGTGSSYGIPQAMESWSSEVSQYNSADPVASHFTQMVWKGTTQVGCAVASCSGIFAASFGLASYYVCEYSPQGNVIGEFAQNVQA
ncbi:CAP domain-containing protein [Rhodocollybia butyracea]|uniref:CAP domain-containing protein n=1 Tax=Rhodocollybia butyracea TaxID=206335 RepID=A0A9P5PRD3_9AGAR|nr:CAP domain-containing protein [Rhodocollybia butyracea]